MKNEKIVNLNGQKYDSTASLPIVKLTSLPKDIKKPVSHNIALLSRKVGHSMDIARSKKVTHFAPHSIIKPVKLTTVKQQMDIRPVKHSLMAKVEKMRLLTKVLPAQPVITKTAKVIKEEAIAEALEKSSEKQKPKDNAFKRHSKFFNIFSISVVLLVIVGYLIYVNMPSLSVRIASAQAGINATYPEYQPSGYSLNGPVSYSDGEVTISFRANTGNTKFIIKQSRSSWDSSAVKDKVNKDSSGEFITTEERGLTIYTYDNNATWVNGGILYTITGDAPLSSDQIRHIATSL